MYCLHKSGKVCTQFQEKNSYSYILSCCNYGRAKCSYENIFWFWTVILVKNEAWNITYQLPLFQWPAAFPALIVGRMEHVNIWGWTDGEASLMMYGFFTSTHQSDVCSGVCAHSFKLDRIKEGSTLVPTPMPALCHLKYRKVGRAWYTIYVHVRG